MGALTSNRKRTDDFITSNYKSPVSIPPNFNFPPQFHPHVSKKPKLGKSPFIVQNPSPDQRIESKFTAARIIHQYPDPVTRYRREVHAPCRVIKFGSSSRRSTSSIGGVFKVRVSERGSSVDVYYEKVKRNALDSLRYLKRESDVIEVDDNENAEVDDNENAEVVNIDDDDSDDGGSEIENSEDWREGRSVFLEKNSKETNGVVGNSGKFKGNDNNFLDLTNGDLKVDRDRNMLDSLSLNRDLDVFGGSVHKTLLESAERRNAKLRLLQFQIDLSKKRLEGLQLLRPINKSEEVKEDVVTEPFVPLTQEEEADVSHAFANSNRRRVLVNHENSNIEITGQVLQCLGPGQWLNDEVINLYLELLKEREKREPKRFLKCHFFNTFFYKKLIGGRAGYDFKAVKRWTSQRKLGYCLLECDKIFVPIHKEIHWCLAVINTKDEKFQYLDSLGGIDTHVIKVLVKYFVDEVKDKSGEDIDVSSWKKEFVKDLPAQENGYDCGMFMIKYADFYSRGLGLCFNQEHMPYFRLRTAKEILRLKAE